MKFNKRKFQKLTVAFLCVSAISQSYAQTCKTQSIQATTPDTRFEILSDGSEVKDSITGLIWQRCSLGQTWDGETCLGIANLYNWKDALQASQNISLGYRVPNIKELMSIVEEQCYEPSINQKIFPNTVSSDYWSSTPYTKGDLHAYGISFDYGEDFYVGKVVKKPVRVVRF